MEQVVDAVQAHDPHAPEAVVVDGRRPAAVLVPIYDDGGEAAVVLTRRSWHLRSHRGEVCFPGGRQDPEDADLVTTALREAREEVALDPGRVEIVGELDRLTTVSSPALIVPIVGRLPARPDLVPAEEEVDSVLYVPFSELLDPAIYREEIWPLGGSHSISFFELQGDTLWGATARMLHNLLGLITADLAPPASTRPGGAELLEPRAR